MNIFDRALDFVQDGDVVGLGTGRAATQFIHRLADRVRQGFRVQGVPTSHASEELARSLGIPLVTLDDHLPLALTVDGADEVDLELNLIKGYGRALVREKIVAAASRRLIIVVGKEKSVHTLGSRGKLPIETIPFAVPLVLHRLAALGLSGVPYTREGRLVLSDNGNAIIDAVVSPMEDPARLERDLVHIPGVVGTGLFLDMASIVLIGDEARDFTLLEERRRNDAVGDPGP
ncbi:MAG: ribose-5-phosphate isomerase RpiA [Gemmataceae bacterium]